MKGKVKFTAETQRDAEGARSNSILCNVSASLCVSAVNLSFIFSRSIFKRACGFLITLALLSALSTVHEARTAETTIDLVSVGDILLDRGVARKIEGAGTRVVFERVRDVLSKGDLTFGNLECPLTTRCDKAPGRISFQANPLYADSLTDAGFDILSLANNHSMDCGRTGLLETMKNLKRVGVRWCGAGGTLAEAEAPVILNLKGIRIAFVGFTAIAPAVASAPMKDNEAMVALASREALKRAVARAAREADVVVASLHWGVEYASRPDAEQAELAHAAVEAGAALVLGHHTHTLEGMELIARRTDAGTRYALVAYSLGNFAFDSPRAVGRRVTESIILRCKLGRNGLVSAEAIPVILENYLPRPASQDEARAILTRLGTLSAELSTQITNGRITLQ